MFYPKIIAYFQHYFSYTRPLPIIMKNIPLLILTLILTLILIASCDSKQTSSELEKLTKKLTEKENQISELQSQIENLEKVNKLSLIHI